VLLSEDADGVRTLTLNRPDHKNAINAQLWEELADATLRETLANEARAQPGNFATADSIEAYAAFAEKREPAFSGRWAVMPRSE
jgi:enoyl-CoA hydratase/carnithine racemase